LLILSRKKSHDVVNDITLAESDLVISGCLVYCFLGDLFLAQGTINVVLHPTVHANLVEAVSPVARQHYDLILVLTTESRLCFFWR